MVPGSPPSRSATRSQRFRTYWCAGALALCLGGFAADTHSATYYRWVDDQGTPHFTSTPPKGRPAEKVNVGTGTPAPQPTAKPADEQTSANARTGEQQQAQQKDPERCAIARERVQTLESGQRIRMTTEDGGFKYLTPEDIEEELARSQQAIAESC